MASIYDKLSRVRKPRIHITYNVETEGAEVKRELPFVVGVMGDFSGRPTEKLAPLDERNFVTIDRDNFDNVMARMTPGLQFRAENTLAADGSEIPVELKFSKMEDFEPANVLQQVEPLRRLMETRNNLRDLLTKVDRSANLEALLEEVLNDHAKLAELSAALEGPATADTGEGDKT